MNPDFKKLLRSDASITAAIEELKRRKSDEKGREHPFYQWRPRCAPWHPAGNLRYQELIMRCKARMMAVIAANRGGKTLSGIILTICRAIGFHPLFRDITWETPQNIWIGAEPKLCRKLFRMLVLYLPKRYVKKNGIYWSHGEERIELTNGSVISMKSTGQPREEWQMDEVNFLWFDEEPPQGIWEEALMRLNAADSQLLMTFTAVKGTTFMHDELGGFDEARRNALENDPNDKIGGQIAWFTAKMEDNDTIPRDFIEWRKQSLRRDPDMYAIRMEGKYVELGGKRIFQANCLKRSEEALRNPLETYWFNERGTPHRVQSHVPHLIEVYEYPSAKQEYAIGSDISSGGVDGDWTTAHVLDLRTGKIVCKARLKIDPFEWGKNLAFLGKWYNAAWINWEMNHEGAAVLNGLRVMGYPKLVKRESFAGKIHTQLDQWGFQTSGNSKHTIIHRLQAELSEGHILCPDKETIEELRNFGYIRKDPGNSRFRGMAAMSGHDDLVMSLAITCYTASRVQSSGKMEPEKNFGDLLEEETLRRMKSGRRSLMPSGGILP